MITSSEAIVINSKKYGDSSKIVSLYTKADGKINLIAKSARTSKNKYGASLEPMSQIYATYYKKSGSGLHLLSNAELITQFKGLIQSLEIMSCGLAIIESLKLTQDENEQNIELFELVSHSLNILNTESTNPFSVFISFLINLCLIMGFETNFGSFNETFSDDIFYFSFTNGCIISKSQNDSTNVFKMRYEILKILTHLSLYKLSESTNIAINDKNRKETLLFFEKYISYHLEKSINFRSFDFINY